MHLIEILYILSELSAWRYATLLSVGIIAFIYFLWLESWLLYAASCCVMALAMY